jgi:hypothetical protein
MQSTEDYIEVKGKLEAMLYLWRVHNNINEMVSGLEVLHNDQDPLVPKVPFPSHGACPTCYVKERAVHPNPLVAKSSSCAGSCGGGTGDCHCDEQCEFDNDCCFDYYTQCKKQGDAFGTEVEWDEWEVFQFLLAYFTPFDSASAPLPGSVAYTMPDYTRKALDLMLASEKASEGFVQEQHARSRTGAAGTTREEYNAKNPLASYGYGVGAEGTSADPNGYGTDGTEKTAKGDMMESLRKRIMDQFANNGQAGGAGNALAVAGGAKEPELTWQQKLMKQYKDKMMDQYKSQGTGAETGSSASAGGSWQEQMKRMQQQQQQGGGGGMGQAGASQGGYGGQAYGGQGGYGGQGQAGQGGYGGQGQGQGNNQLHQHMMQQQQQQQQHQQQHPQMQQQQQQQYQQMMQKQQQQQQQQQMGGMGGMGGGRGSYGQGGQGGGYGQGGQGGGGGMQQQQMQQMQQQQRQQQQMAQAGMGGGRGGYGQGGQGGGGMGGMSGMQQQQMAQARQQMGGGGGMGGQGGGMGGYGGGRGGMSGMGGGMGGMGGYGGGMGGYGGGMGGMGGYGGGRGGYGGHHEL